MTLYIIIVTVIVSLICFQNQQISSKLIHNPYIVKHQNQWYRLVTSGFLHANFLHLFINMFVLYSFGNAVEYYYQTIFPVGGKYLYIVLYFTAIYASNLFTQYKQQNNSAYNSLGASGAVSAVVFASILFAPYNKIYLYGIIGIPGIILGIIYLGYSYYASKKQNDNINHEAHLYGAIYGMLFTIVLKPKVALIFYQQLINF
jgi:membrane associated rhomboid family serine protease